jgi:hypothetical protein
MTDRVTSRVTSRPVGRAAVAATVVLMCVTQLLRAAPAAEGGDRRDGPPVEALLHAAYDAPGDAARGDAFHVDIPEHRDQVVVPLCEVIRQWRRLDSVLRERGGAEPQEPVACVMVGFPCRRPGADALAAATLSHEGDLADLSDDEGDLRLCFRRTPAGWKWDATTQFGLHEEGAARSLGGYLKALAAALGEAATNETAAAAAGREPAAIVAEVDRAVCLRLLAPHFKASVAVAPAKAEARRIADRAGSLSCLAASPDGKLVAAGATRCATPLRLWDAGTGAATEVRLPADSVQQVLAVAFAPDGKRLAATGLSYATAELLLHFRHSPHAEPWDNVRSTSRVWLFDVGGGGDAVALDPSKHDLSETLAFSPDGSRIAATSVSQTVVWDAKTGKVSLELPGGEALAYTPAGELAVLGLNVRVSVYDPQTGRLLREFPANKDPGTRIRGAMTVSPDGSTLAYGTLTSVNLISTSDGKSIRQFMLPGALGGWNRVNALVFSEDGGRLLAATGLYTLDDREQPQLIRLSPTRLVCLWDLASGRLIRRLEGHAGAVCGATFLGDQSAVVSASTDGTIRVWPVPPAAPESR